MIETKIDLLKDLGISKDYSSESLDKLVEGESKYLRDLRINYKNGVNTDNLSPKEAYLTALAIAVNEKNNILIKGFTKLAEENEATKEEIAEAHACTSLLSVNNVFYRFRHFAAKDSYNSMPARIKMNIMMRPVLGKELFELISLAVSAVNGCESCVKSHEASLVNMGTKEERIFDAVRLAAIIRGLSQIVN